MALLDSRVHEFHKIGLDNLYISAKFAKAAFNHTKKVIIAGVARKGMRGIPACAQQASPLANSPHLAAHKQECPASLSE